MLNELYQLSQTLEKQGLLPDGTTHRDVHKLAKCECLYLLLDEKGMPVSMRLLGKEESAKLWVHSKGNHCRFPAIKVQKPLLSGDQHIDEKLWGKSDLENRRRLLLELDYTRENPMSRDIQVKPWTLEQMKPVLESKKNGESGKSGEDARLEALRRLLERFPTDENVTTFYAAFRQLIHDNIKTANEPRADFLKKLLVGTYDAKKQDYQAGCVCYFDIRELSQVIYAVADPMTERALIQKLIEAGREEKESENGGDRGANGDGENGADCRGGNFGISALSGTRVPLVRDKYPNPKFQVIGPAYLYSNNTGAAPCLTRYGLSGTAAFPAGEDQVNQMSESLNFLMDDLRKDMTWKSFWGTSAKQPLLLLAWLEDDPRCDAKLAFALGDEGGTIIYEQTCKRVLDILKLKLDADPDEPVHLQLFEVLDTGRKQICYSHIMKVGELYRNVEEWTEAAGNISDIFFRVKWKNKEGKEINRIRPLCPGPGAVSKVLRTRYRTQNSDKVGRIQDRRSGLLTEEQIYRLFIPDTYGSGEDQRLVERCMKEVLRTCSDLLLDAGKFQLLHEKKHPFSEDALRRTCAAVELLGILLYKKGIRKEQYMESKMFLLGQMMKLANCLHRNYSIIVRNSESLENHKKPLPGQLAGSSVYQIALQKPEEALKRLSDRIKIYVDWAEATPDCHSMWILQSMEKTCTKMGLSDSKFPEKPTSADQAELIMGYMGEAPYYGKKNKDGNVVDQSKGGEA